MGYIVVLGVIFNSIMCITTAYHPANCDISETYYTIFKVGKHNCSCQANRAGQLKFDNGKIFVCTGSEWKALMYDEYGINSRNPGYSCKDIKDNARQSATGIYWITLNHRKDAFPVYCDMAAGGWTMVFKAVSGVHKNVYEVYKSGHTSSEDVMRALDVTDKYQDHYKNRIILNWKAFDASEARVVLYRGGNLVKELKFNAKGTDNQNWFQFSKMTQSPWSDIKIKNQPRNYFSIRGEPAHKRHFFINRNYGGCPADAGWMVIAGPICAWENHYTRKNPILYSKLRGYANWNKHENIGEADVLVVYLR